MTNQVQQHIQSLVHTKSELTAAVADVAKRGLELQAWGAKEERALHAASINGSNADDHGVDIGTGNGSATSSAGGDTGASNSTDANDTTLGTNGANNGTIPATTTATNPSSNNSNDDARLLSCFVPYDPASQQLVELHAELRYTTCPLPSPSTSPLSSILISYSSRNPNPYLLLKSQS